MVELASVVVDPCLPSLCHCSFSEVGKYEPYTESSRTEEKLLLETSCDLDRGKASERERRSTATRMMKLQGK